MPQNALEHKNYKDAAQFPLFRIGCLHNGLTSSYSRVYIGIPRGCYFLSPRRPCQGVTVRIWLLLHYDVCTHYPMIYTGVPGGPRLPRVPTNFLWGTRTQLPLRLSYVWEVIKMRTVMNKMTNECLRCWIKVRGIILLLWGFMGPESGLLTSVYLCVTPSGFWDFTDMPLAYEDTNSKLVMPIGQSKPCRRQVAPLGDQIILYLYIRQRNFDIGSRRSRRILWTIFHPGKGRTLCLANASRCPTQSAALEVRIFVIRSVNQDVLEQIKFADLLGKRNRCNDGFRCAECLADQDCPTREVSMMMRMVRMVIYIITVWGIRNN